ncbi:hypothetical protein HZ84_003999 [Escherichia coli]|uniref:hypothetical protein n=1 Tax=Citrobacter freundii complex TaxID=1344959 RepID=UPI0015EAC3B4|nr:MULTISPECIES: hypothetical protein [Citrobacter freundii complex]EFL9618786.1 hypothetical protein [Escherichia coli]EIQ9245343.1 hypothetical protein [Escherichia coli]MCQ6312357.1 hypothetical protein [Citrobacter portucalensis]QLV95553.1 hypothetical protein HV270_26415 [Citrobacter freundii]
MNSNYSIPFTLTNVSAVAVAAIDASKTATVGSNLNQSLWAGVGVFARGKPFKALKVTKSNYMDVLGDPIRPQEGSHFEPMRHVYEAVQQTDGYVVRVVPDDAKFPIISFTKESSSTGVNNAVPSNSALAYGQKTELKDKQFLMIYPVDGDPSTNRSISFTPDKTNPNRLTLTLKETSKLGTVTVLENIVVSLNSDEMDAMGRPCFITTALESRSAYLGATCDLTAAEGVNLGNIADVKFTGGTNGDQTKITDEQYAKAIEVLNNANVNYTAVLGLGCYSTASYTLLGDICQDRRIDGFFDIKPTLTYAEALTEMESTGLVGVDYVSCSMYHFPFTCKDKWTQARVAYGLSGAAYAAKARGIALNTDVGGWHYSPAGETRALINRAQLEPIDGIGTPDFDAMYTARINKVATSSTGQMIIDDALTTYSEENYLRFQHVSSTFDAISRFFFQLGRKLKHQPDGVTEESLTREMTKVLERFHAAGALVTPRDPETDGTAPFILVVKQVDVDYWSVTWWACPTGSARRLLGKPVVIR